MQPYFFASSSLITTRRISPKLFFTSSFVHIMSANSPHPSPPSSSSKKRLFYRAHSSSSSFHHRSPIPVRGFIFDMDGTLTKPVIDFVGLRKALGIPKPLDLLTELENMTPEGREKSLRIIESFEEVGREKFELQPGAEELIRFIEEELQLPKALFTRNSIKAIDFLQEKTGFNFHIALSRDFLPVKPAPEGALHIAQNHFRVAPHECVFIGDSIDDLKCGKEAGMVTFLLDEEGKKKEIHPWADIVVPSLSLIPGILSQGFHVEREHE